MRNNKNKSYTSITNSLKNGIYEIDKHLYSTTKRNWGLMHIYLDINIDDIDTFHIFPLARITMHFTYRKKGTDNNDRMVGESVILHPVSYTHLRAHETPEHLVCRLLLEKKKKKRQVQILSV